MAAWRENVAVQIPSSNLDAVTDFDLGGQATFTYPRKDADKVSAHKIAREDFPTRQDPLSHRLYLFPWEFMHQAHFCC